MESTVIDEPVDVGAVFGKNRIKPKWFVWQNRKHTVTETTYTWRETEGEAVVVHFTVTDGATLFELSLNQKTLCWRLVKTIVN
jgi:hypothetical protein